MLEAQHGCMDCSMFDEGKPHISKLPSREEEILGWSVYFQELASWASQGSVKFGREIEQSSRWLEPIRWSKLSLDQQSRAVRLCALLNAAFAEHVWISLMIQGFQEGLDVLPEVAGYPLVTLEDVFMPGIPHQGHGLIHIITVLFCRISTSISTKIVLKSATLWATDY